MTLIDVDTLKQYIGDCKCCDKCPNKGRKQYECYYDCKFPDYLTEEWERVLDEQPTVDAIPIEWIEGIIGMLKMHYEFGNEETREPSYYGFRVLQSVINGWRKHNETD